MNILFLRICTLFLIVSSFSAAQAADARQVIRVAISSDIASTEFATKNDDNTTMVLHHVMESLVAYRDDMTLAPNLASGWTVSDDGKTYRFTIRDGVTFHNGQPLTAQIVKWNFDRFMDPSRNWGTNCRPQIDGGFEEYIRPSYIVSVAAPDTRTVEIRLQSPSAMFPHHLASNHCIYGIIHPDSVAADGSWSKPVGTGPYRFVEWRKGDGVILERYKGYVADRGQASGLAGSRKAIADRVEFRVVTDAARAARMLKAGELDLVPDVKETNRALYSGAARVRMVPQETAEALMLAIQTRDPVMRDPRIRLAVAHAMDREAIVDAVLGREGRANPSMIARGLPQYSAIHADAVPHDPARARALLAEAGYKGERIDILASGDVYPVNLAVARMLQGEMAAAGFNAAVKEVPWQTQYETYGSHNYQITPIIFSARTDPALMYSAIVGQKGDHAWYLWEDQEADMLTNMAAVEADPATRQQLFDRLHRKAIAWNPVIMIGNYVRVDAVGPALARYRGWTMGIPRMWDMDAK
ncbi:MAG: hypothetical protein JNM03_02495 [Sphingopyxis sp.]|jgi:peptide/nickel transport system substrate-binding protein|uniref:ABC transporter substrate-binding protein n=1 Tax=Sphingopyxis sp. TaxID=1908224 RepID=UPI001A52C147|nr:ABC transporter substrate-binding protein [Sphingopyxis sp.]MBL9068843.1 hypothetical protein [Sphingopyxis sp.]